MKPKPTHEEKLEKGARKFLEEPVWMPELEPMHSYIRLHDDHDGTGKGKISVTFSDDGDAWIEVEPNHHGGPLRFRSGFGGGQSPRVRAALILLATAIKRDNEQKP